MQHLSDRDILTDFLKDAKFKSTAYHHAALESASSAVRDTCVRFMSDELQNQKSVFDAMVSRGWYQVQAATPGGSTLPLGRAVSGPGGFTGPGGYQDTGYAGDYRRQHGPFPGQEGPGYTAGYDRTQEPWRQQESQRRPHDGR
jgi:hypothetical protein